MDHSQGKHLIPCPNHPAHLLSIINPDPSSQKHVYCLACLMQTEDPKTLYANSQTIIDFLTHSATTFAELREQIKPVSEIPKKYVDVASRQAESLERLSKHITEEKKKIGAFFEHIKNNVIDILDQLKNEHLEILDKQVTRLHDGYVFFEKRLKTLYPKKEDIDMMFPPKENMEERLLQLTSALELDKFVTDIKRTLAFNQDPDMNANQSDNAKQKYLSHLDNQLKENEKKKPTFEENNTLKAKVEETKKHLTQLFGTDKALTLKDSITKMDAFNFPQSMIIQPEDFGTLKEWLPSTIKFNPKLLYRMTRDGERSEAFHYHCDKKGLTITLIKCKYEGAQQTSIIGGFSDQDFDQNGNGFLYSNEAFIFSLAPKAKYRVLKPQEAVFNGVYCGDVLDIWFGNHGTIGIKKDFSSCTSYIISDPSYEDNFKIIPSEVYKGFHLYHNFTPEEVEIYTVE